MAKMAEDSMTKQADIDNLLDHFTKNAYSAKGDVTGMLAMNTCLDLFSKDYTYTVINNSGGALCGHYPSKIVVLDYEGTSTDNVDNRYQSLVDCHKLEELMRHARLARCWTRFVVPVILYKGKHICRSATLAGWQELFGRKGMDMVLSGGMTNGRTASEEIQPPVPTNVSGSQQIFDRHRGQDIRLLEELNVKYICDLMVEMKKAKYGFNVSSSEKVDKENRYKNFGVICLPYPGCEFFACWKESKYDSENIHYDWSQELNTALLDIQNDPLLSTMPTDWSSYKEWNIVKLTQNYLQGLIRLIDQGSSGILVHCISGWDRTPLFISLLRLSLWADGAIHKSLPPSDILYLTLAYDWYLFGHGLPDRLSKGQEIMYFCFKMLHYISGEEFSVSPRSDGSSQHPSYQGSPASHQSSPHSHHSSPFSHHSSPLSHHSSPSSHQNSPQNQQQSSPGQADSSKHASPVSCKDVQGLRHQGSNISLFSNNSYGSDGGTFVLDTTQDEDSISPLGWDMSPSAYRSRHTSGNSVEEHRSRRSKMEKGSNSVDFPPHHHPHRHHRAGSGTAHSEGLRGQSPEVSRSPESFGYHGGSTAPVDQPLALSSTSNHYSSSPVNVPARPPPAQPDQNPSSFSHTPTFGSWVDVGFPQMTPPFVITPPKNPAGEFHADNSINSCQEASDLNHMTSRRRKLSMVAQMFEEAYVKAVLSRPVNASGTLSSIIGNVAVKMGFRSGSR